MESLTLDAQRLVHLDFKGAPLKVSYFEKLFPLLRDLGATGLLIEWEDTFPYSKEVTEIGGLSLNASTRGNPYSIEDASQILILAADCGLNVIPLVQTIGHLEFVLKHDEWRTLREVEAYPSSMCPTHSGALPLIRSMVKQVIALHTDIQYIHIGADEVWHIGLCSACERRAITSKYGKASLFLEHVSNVCQYIKELYPTLKIIIWDDMLRNIEPSALQEYNLGNLVEPMIWHYHNADTFNLGLPLWEKYSNIFSHVWAASAFKGATGSCQLLPIHKHHISNHERWLLELNTYASKIQNFRGMAFTGWSRYDHYAALCELLPCAIPTLGICLKMWISGGMNPQVVSTVGKMLGVTQPMLLLDFPNFPSSVTPTLSFPGWQILTGVEWLSNIRTKYKNIVNSDQLQTWFNTWQIQYNYTNPMQIESLLPLLTDFFTEITALEEYLRGQLDMIYYRTTIEEFLGTYFLPMKEHIKQLKADCETQLANGCRPAPKNNIVFHR